jgi:hypothetical protein
MAGVPMSLDAARRAAGQVKTVATVFAGKLQQAQLE